MFGRKKKSPESEIITKADELRLIIDMRETKKKYEEALAEMKVKRKELDEALKNAYLILKELKATENTVKE